MRLLLHSLVAALAVASVPAPARAQEHAHAGMSMPTDSAPRADAHASMSMGMGTSSHMRMTSPRVATPADSAHARAVVNTLRQSIAKYADTSVAVADGYRMFKPQLSFRPVYHFTSRQNARANESGFDPARPTSLLYERGPDGRLQLIGAMFTAPRAATEDELNARVPLGIAPWHLHVNLCEAPPNAPQLRRQTRDGRMLFGPAGQISTKAECDAVGGEFRPVDFNWMVHVDIRHGDNLAAAFSDHK